MYKFRKEGISKSERLFLVKLYKNIQNALPIECNGTDGQRDGIEELIIQTIRVIPNILYIYNDKNIGLIDLLIEHKLWGALVEVAKNKEFAEEIDKKLIKARNKEKAKQGKEV